MKINPFFIFFTSSNLITNFHRHFINFINIHTTIKFEFSIKSPLAERNEDDMEQL